MEKARKKRRQQARIGGFHPVDVHVGDRVKARRAELGISQTALGKAIGITFQQIQKCEKGANRIGAGRLYQFTGILDVPVSYFFEGLETEPNEPDVMETQEAQALIEAYCTIDDPAVRLRVRELAKAMVKGE